MSAAACYVPLTERQALILGELESKGCVEVCDMLQSLDICKAELAVDLGVLMARGHRLAISSQIITLDTLEGL